MTAPWVRVSSANGYTGWVFSGYLQAIQEMAVTVWQEIVSKNPPGTVYQAAVMVQDDARSIPLIALICGTAAAVSITIISLTAKRKRYRRRKRKINFYAN
jgi:O-antigen/teichoic acid export membrane protein